MKNTNTRAFRETVFDYLCESAYDFEGTQEETARHIRERFDAEFNYPQNRQRIPNEQARVAEWLAGLALNVDCYYADIRATAEKWHECKLTEEQANMVQEKWFHFLAFSLIQLWRKHGVAA